MPTPAVVEASRGRGCRHRVSRGPSARLATRPLAACRHMKAPGGDEARGATPRGCQGPSWAHYKASLAHRKPHRAGTSRLWKRAASDEQGCAVDADAVRRVGQGAAAPGQGEAGSGQGSGLMPQTLLFPANARFWSGWSGQNVAERQSISKQRQESRMCLLVGPTGWKP